MDMFNADLDKDFFNMLYCCILKEAEIEADYSLLTGDFNCSVMLKIVLKRKKIEPKFKED